MVVFDSADLDSTVEGIVDAIWFNQGQVRYFSDFAAVLLLFQHSQT